MKDGLVSAFLKRNFRHFNAASLVEAANGYKHHLQNDGLMFVALAGAMSTAELGISLAEMIRQEKIHAICCTGANLEEDIFNLIAHNSYKNIPNYRDLTPADELELFEHDLNRVTDTCIPENEAIRKLEKAILDEWVLADTSGARLFPHEFLFNLLRDGKLKDSYEIDVRDSWLYAAMENNLPIFVPGWEDSTLGNMYAAHFMAGNIKNVHTVKTGIEYLLQLADWYAGIAKEHSLGFFQIGGGIAGDFAICVVPMLREDFRKGDVPLWGYYCQISESTTSYGSYSGAPPNEKITWGKLAVETPKFIIESDATIVAPLIFAIVLEY
ncbi:MAG TPA: deoxyhypusine synthase family protein [Pyrinomonadaceae bacterium]|jgi:deoxyhypusine synthase